MNDPVIDEIRRVRHLISAEMQHDPSKLAEYYRQAASDFRRPALTETDRRTKIGIGAALLRTPATPPSMRVRPRC